MAQPDTRDYLHEELKRRVREMQFEQAKTFVSVRRRQKQRRMGALVLAISSITTAVYFFLSRDLEALRIPLMLSLGVAFSIFALYYLQPSSIGRFDFPTDSESFHRIGQYVDERIAEAVEKLKGAAGKSLEFTEQDKAQVLASIQAKLESESLEQYLSGLRDLVLTRVRDETLDERFQHTRRRLGQEVQDLAKRGNLNLILGILTTIAGLSVLGYAVFNPPATVAAPELLSHFVPRVSLVVLIEVFAYFFLRLYKQSLGEIKYFQNEITNIEAKHLALQVALRTDDPGLRSKIVESLAGTERNFILTKDQTTVDLERERLARSTYASITDAIKDLLKKKGDG